jgi:hypothetical protein
MKDACIRSACKEFVKKRYKERRYTCDPNYFLTVYCLIITAVLVNFGGVGEGYFPHLGHKIGQLTSKGRQSLIPAAKTP